MMLDDLTREEMQQFEKVGRVRDYAVGDPVVREGESGSSFFLILSGRAEVRTNVGSATYRKLMDVGPCGVFGEICFLGAQNRSASVIATQACKAIEFHRADFENFVQQHPLIGMKVYRGMARELAFRLTKNNDELRRAILWALDEMRDRNQLFLSSRPLDELVAGSAAALTTAASTSGQPVDIPAKPAGRIKKA